MNLTNRINELQVGIMEFVIEWGNNNDKPIPIRLVMQTMESNGFSRSRIIRAFRGLVKKGYLRRSNDRSTSSSYIRLRGI